MVNLSLPQSDGEDVGSEGSGPPPTGRAPLLHIGRGSGLGPAHESEIDGVAFQTVTRLVVRFTTGAPVAVVPRQAPAGDRDRLAFLRPLRFFMVFFPGTRTPTTITALSRTGRVLGRLPRRPRSR